MGNFFTDNEDLQFYFDKGIDWAPLVEVTERRFNADGHKNVEDAVAFYRQVADLVGNFAADEIAPRSAEIDSGHVKVVDGEAVFPPVVDDLMDKLNKLELHGLCVPRELGGMNVPVLAYFTNIELMGRADVSIMSNFGFRGGMAMSMLSYSINEGTTEIDKDFHITKTRFREAVDDIVRGDACGSMDITEPNAGSDMAQLRTVGEQDADGNWFVTGQKIFITCGHGKYHFVIARTEKATPGDDTFAGLKGLSMFLVPAYEDTPNGRKRFVTIDRIDDKMGQHGSATAAVNFDHSPAHLIGKRGDGFKHMLLLMNNARVGVGFESLGICESAYRKAKAYAEERWSMGKPIARHELIADMLDEMRTDIQAIRAMAMYGGFHEEMAQKTQIALRFVGESDGQHLGRERRRHAAKARRVTPLLKYLASEKAVEMSRRCIQIHGGSGYMKEYGAEKLLRDSMVMPIFEGTSQIQALMAMKDTLSGIMKRPRAFVLKQAQARWRSVSARDPLERRVAKLQVQSLSAQNHLITRTAGDKLRTLPDKPVSEWVSMLSREWDPKRDFALAMLHAERLTKLLADEMVCEILYDQGRKFPERREVLERYLDRAEPRCRFLLDEITSTGSRLLESLERQDEEKKATG